MACIFFDDERSPFEIRGASAPVQSDRQCRTINIGVYDNDSLGPVRTTGNGRIYQAITEQQSLVLLGDCNTREVTILRGPGTLIGETSCGPDFSFAPIVGDDAVFDLAQGDDLHELVDLAKSQGMREIDPVKRFFEFAVNYGDQEQHEVGGRDRFDLLCGCKTFYPNSAGGKQ